MLAAVAPSVAGTPELINAGQAPAGMALVRAGFYKPLFRTATGPDEIPVRSFYLDVCPVTKGAFLEFVRANPEWRRSVVKRELADELYLRDWAGDLDLGTNGGLTQFQPVTEISWCAAKAYAAWQGKRLPTLAEWERAASAGPGRPDGANDPVFTAQILKWYSTPGGGTLAGVGLGSTNFWGIHDLHGLVWEWVIDFESAAVSTNGGGSGKPRDAICGGGAQNASDAGNYPAFMRNALRSSLKPNYCIHNLGFRCASDAYDEARIAGEPQRAPTLEPASFPASIKVLPPPGAR